MSKLLLTDEQLKAIMPGLSQAKRRLYLPLLNAAMDEFEINTPKRVAAFVAQLAHESAQLRYFEEIASGAAYEGRKDLGNVRKGDGKRYKGRGPIQLTGRSNYRRYGELLGLDLESNPAQAATPEVGFRIAGLYWKDKKLNALADRDDFKAITKKINGGYNGLADRIEYWERAKEVLGEGETDTEEIVAVEKPPPKNFAKEIRNDMAAVGAGEVAIQTVREVAEQASFLGISARYWMWISFIAITIGAAYLIMKFYKYRSEVKRDLEITNQLIASNSTPNNQVILVDAEKIPEYEKLKYKIVRR